MSRSSFKSISGFDPRSIPGCQVWFDGADRSTITGSNTVTAWRDKSKNGWNATTLIGTAPTNTTVNGNNAVSFAGQSTLTVPNVSFSSVQSRAIFIVYRVVTSTPNFISFFSTQWSGANNQGGHNNLIYPSGGGGPYLQSYAVGGAVQGVGADPAVSTIGSTAIACMIHSAVSTANNVVTLNGTSYTLTTSTVASGYGSDTVTYYIGNAYTQPYILCEYILYQEEFTVGQRQQVEGYLAHKWGINTSLPTIHPSRYIKPFSRRFVPIDIDDCVLWLDSADGPTVSLSGNNVLSWTDKIQQLTFNPLNAGYYPTRQATGGILFGNASSNLSGTSQGLFTHTQWILPTQNFTLFCVSYPLTIDAYRNACFFGSDAYGGATLPNFLMTIEMGNSGNSSNSMLFDYNGSSWGQTIIGNTNTTSAPRIDVLVSSAGATSGWNFINGTENSYTSSNVYTSSYTNYPVNVSYLGAFTSTVQGHRNFNGRIYEIIVYAKALSASDRRSVEGYLANKWKFPSSLIANHPFRTFPPLTTIPFSPTNISNCILWLDPTNTSTLTLSGSNVVSINDLSASGSNATRYNGSAYATTATVSGSTVLSFPGSNIVYRSAMTLSGSAYTIFVVMGLVSTTGNGSGFQRAVNADSGNGTIFIGAQDGRLATFCGNNGFNDTNMNTPVYTLTGNGLQLVTMYVDGSTLVPIINGTVMDIKTGTTGATTVLDIGAYQDGSTQSWNGYIGDIIVYSRALTEAEVQQTEGYLAWKWKLDKRLPVTHPFYSYRPKQSAPIVVLGGGGGGGGGSTTVNFSYTGSDQYWTAPAGVTSITVTLNGAGGGNSYGSSGGAGGLVSGTLAVMPGYTYTIIVGQGGGSGYYQTYGGGGGSGVYGYGSQGGGRSAIAYGGTDLVTAGAGGGGAYYTNGGAGGGTDGASGNGATGGGQYSGGYPSTSYGGFEFDGNYGGQYYGGNGGYYYGSGGGSGWYGGGGGGYYDQSGGGGSSYVGSLTGTVVNTQGAGAASATNGSITIVFTSGGGGASGASGATGASGSSGSSGGSGPPA
jgi:hypothetical protein